jgi:hypothetical protein
VTRGGENQDRPDAANAPRLFTDEELDELERLYPDGLTAAQVVERFQSRGVKLSEATFRKYVQLGLAPRSRRVGRKGKHQGSMGLYPATAIRRVNAIKRMMAEAYTIEDIQKTFLRFRDEIEAVERSLKTLFANFEAELEGPEFDAGRRRTLSRDLEEAQRVAEDLVERVEGLERQIVLPHERAARARAFSSGASGGAGDLL